MMTDFTLGIDLGGTNTKMGIVDATGQLLEQRSYPTNSHKGPDGVLAEMAANGLKLISETGRTVKTVGIGSPGPINGKLGIVYEAPNLGGWVNVEVTKILQQHMQLPVTLSNDANAAAYGEWWAGAGTEIDTMILLTLGTGVGGGIVINDELYSGIDDTAGELGHVIINFDGPLCGCGNRGCIEAYASATAILRDVRAAIAAGEPTSLKLPEGDDPDFGTKQVYDAALAGDALSIRIFERMGFTLGITCATLINSLNPEMIAFGGAMSNAWELFQPIMVDTIKKNAFEAPANRCRIERARLGNDAGIIGAAGLAMKAQR